MSQAVYDQTVDRWLLTQFTTRGLDDPSDQAGRLTRSSSSISSAIACGVDGYATVQHRWLQANAGRFGFHDLLRRYAHQHAWHTDGRLPHDGAIQRLLSWYLHTVDAAVGLLYPDPLGQPPGRQGGSTESWSQPDRRWPATGRSWTISASAAEGGSWGWRAAARRSRRRSPSGHRGSC